MPKKNKFHVKKIIENKSEIIVEEERKDHSPFIFFLLHNGKLIFITSLILSFTVFLIAAGLTISNLKSSTIVKYESNKVIVSFDGTDNSILNGTPITKEYASKLFDTETVENTSEGVVIMLKKVPFKGGTISFYSDKTALVKYNDGRYERVFSVNNNYGISESGHINPNAKTLAVTAKKEKNNVFNIEILYLSDGTVEVTKDKTTFFVRNTDITSKDDTFYTNLSGVSPVDKKEGNKIYFTDGTIKENNKITVGNNTYEIKEEKKTQNGIKIIYYTNGYAEIIKGNINVLVQKSDHIVYDDKILEIINNKNNDNPNTSANIKDLMDIKNITIKNTGTKNANYMIVLEETDDYASHNINKVLDTKYILFNVLANNKKISNKILNSNNIKNMPLAGGLKIKNNTYLLYESNLKSKEEVKVKLGLWIDYEDITNEYMNSAFIGTVKVYVESIN